MKKRVFLGIIILIFVVLIFIDLFKGIVMLASAIKKHIPNTKYGEFPFSLTYQVADEITSIEGTYVCEFDGIGWDTGRGFYKKWNGYVKETGLENVLICEDSKRKIFCQVGDPRYYMRDYDYTPLWANDSLSPPHLYIVKKGNNFDHMTVEEIKQTYGIEFISWEFSNPIRVDKKVE